VITSLTKRAPQLLQLLSFVTLERMRVFGEILTLEIAEKSLVSSKQRVDPFTLTALSLNLCQAYATPKKAKTAGSQPAVLASVSYGSPCETFLQTRR
jgi:hypothetical protein